MSDVPVPISAKGGAQKKQLIMLAVLGGLLVLVLVFVVIKPFSGSDSSTSTPPVTVTPTTAPAVPGGAANGASGDRAEGEDSEPVAVERPARNPFTKP